MIFWTSSSDFLIYNQLPVYWCHGSVSFVNPHNQLKKYVEFHQHFFLQKRADSEDLSDSPGPDGKMRRRYRKHGSDSESEEEPVKRSSKTLDIVMYCLFHHTCASLLLFMDVGLYRKEKSITVCKTSPF